MNIPHKDLCAFYRSFVRTRLPESRKDCPSFDDLVRFFRPGTPRRHKTKIIDHMARCAPCAEEFDLILTIKRGSEQMEKEIASYLDSELPSIKSQNRPRLAVSQSFWRYAALVIGIVSLSLSLLTIFDRNPMQFFKQHAWRGPTDSDFQLVEPLNRKQEKSHLVFRLKEYKGAESYILELFDESLKLIWESPELVETKCALPFAIVQKLSSSSTYFWMVTAHLRNGNVVESGLANFGVID